MVECEKAGFGKEIMEIGRKWMILYFNTLVPDAIKKIPPTFLMNTIMKKIWQNLGLMDDLHVEKTGNIINISTRNEGMTRFVGSNSLMLGFYMGVINVVFHSFAAPLEIRQGKKSCSYAFRLDGSPASFQARTKEEYRKLNFIEPIKGYTLKDALEKKIFSMRKDNRISFRGKSISPVENTLFHLVGSSDLLPEKIAEVSYGFFREIIKEEATKEEKISLLKTVFQIMGWGVIKIAVKEKKIVIEIKSPPHGLDLNDNWDYIFRTFLGYMRLFDRRLKLKGVSIKAGYVSAEYYC